MTPRKRSSIVAIGLLLILTACNNGVGPENLFKSPLAPALTVSPLTSPTSSAPEPGAPIGTLTLSPVSPEACVTPTELEASLGRTTCVAATVLATESKGSDFIMWLDKNPQKTYIVVRNTLYLGVEGTCLQVTGEVQKDSEGRLFIRADNPGQIERCTR